MSVLIKQFGFRWADEFRRASYNMKVIFTLRRRYEDSFFSLKFTGSSCYGILHRRKRKFQSDTALFLHAPGTRDVKPVRITYVSTTFLPTYIPPPPPSSTLLSYSLLTRLPNRGRGVIPFLSKNRIRGSCQSSHGSL